MWKSFFIVQAFSMFIIVNSTNVNNTKRGEKVLSLFSIVQFPNLECTTGETTTTPVGTCLASSECTSKGGSSSGNCAAGFGVCCVVQASTCGSTISANTSYIRNPGFPSTYTPTNAGTCVYTINKANDDVCQLRLDFISMSGHALGGAGVEGSCVDSFVAAGQTGTNPPPICGTNTGYHMYVDFGTSSSDTVVLTNNFATAGLSTAKTFNILARQICCSDSWKAPTNCVQYFTGISGSVQSYNHQGSQVLQGMDYTNCIRTEEGYCKITWKQSSTTTPDSFGIGPNAGLAAVDSDTCNAGIGYVAIPNLTSHPDGTTAISVSAPNTLGFQSQVCGGWFGVDGMATSASLTSTQKPFIMGLFTTSAAQPGATGFNMEYTQVPC